MSVYNKDISDSEGAAEKSVHLHLQSRYYRLAGEWEWSLHSTMVYCSDVMPTLPAQYLGTKGIVHPDDVAGLAQTLSDSPGLANFNFRIITTYGKVVTLIGTAIEATEEESFTDTDPAKHLWAQHAAQKQQQKENKRLRHALRWAETAEKYTNTGTWHFNTSTFDIHFSDNLYRLYGLMPQGLNAHLKTFYPFLHPEDAATFQHAFEEAYQNRVPLHLIYRIIDALGELKYLQLITNWEFNEKGELELGGTVIDITAQKKVEAEWEAATESAQFLKDQLQFSEQMTGIGTWQINLFTRKSFFSDNFYRIIGLKPQIANLNLDLLANLAHPDDRNLVAEAHRRILFEHVCPEIEYRIIRNDGKIRYVQFIGKPVIRSKTDLVMIGTLKDVTATRMLERKEVKLKDELGAQRMVQQEVEATTDTFVWLTDLQTGKMTWSPHFYSLLGYKPNFVELTPKLFTNFIHQEDKKKFTDTLNLSLHEQVENEIYFRLIVKGAIKHMKATFKIIQTEGKNLFAAMIQDVSAEIMLQQQQHSLQQWNNILNSSIAEKVFVTNINNTIVDMNEACRDGLLARDQQGLQQNLFDVFPQLQDVDYRTHLEQAFSGKTVSLAANNFLGREKAGHYLLFPLTDSSERVEKVLHLIRETTIEHTLKRKVAVNMRLVESIIELMPGRVIVMDKYMNYVYWNKRCEAHYHVKKEEVIGKNILEFSPGFYDDPSYNQFKKTLAGEVVSISIPSEHSDALQTEALLVPVADDDNKIAYILWVVFDPSDASVFAS